MSTLLEQTHPVKRSRLEGMFLQQQPKNPGVRINGKEKGSIGGNILAPPTIDTLASQGITKKESATAQLVNKAAEKAGGRFEKGQ